MRTRFASLNSIYRSLEKKKAEMGCNFFTEIQKSFLDVPRTNSECPNRLHHERNNYTLEHKPSDQQMKRNLWESRKKGKAYKDLLDK